MHCIDEKLDEKRNRAFNLEITSCCTPLFITLWLYYFSTNKYDTLISFFFSIYLYVEFVRVELYW